MTINFTPRITIIGAGPVGITTAAILSALFPAFQTTVLDHREVRKRNYGLSVDAESTAGIIELMDEVLLNKPTPNSTDEEILRYERIHSFRNIVADWGKGGFVQTNTIEFSVQYAAEALGTKVIRDNNFQNYLTPLKFKSLFTDSHQEGDQKGNELKTLFKNTDILIGADGTKSVVGETFLPEKSFQKIYQHNALLKYQVDGTQAPTHPKIGAYHTSLAGEVAFESVSRNKRDKLKPTTLNIFIDDDVFEILYRKDKDGKVIKGDAAHPYSIQELREEAQKNPKVLKLLRRVLLQIKDKKVIDPSISVLPLAMTQSKHSYTEFEGKAVLKIGDANSTLILQRGFRKGLKEIAILARTMLQVSKTPNDSKKFYAEYEKKVQILYTKERWWVEFRNGFLSAAILIIKLIGRLFQALTRDIYWKNLEAHALMALD